jgi:DNA-binding NtrC family response regulator
MNATAPNRSKPSGPAGKTILLVEDDDCMREDIAYALRKRGYNLIEAADAASALDALHRSQRIDLLFTDIVLADGMSGRGLAQEAQNHRPELPVIFTSGYAPDVVFPEAAHARAVHFLQKPYSRQLLLDKVEAALAA